MKRICCLIAVMPVLANWLCADWKIVTKTGSKTVTEFFKGELMRTDSSPVYSTVLDFGHRRQVTWRSDLRQYTVLEWPPQRAKNSSSSPEIVIEQTTTDTGDRKQFFGRTARHLISRTRRSDGPESVIEGWYVEAPGLPDPKLGGPSAVTILTTSRPGEKPAEPKIQLRQTGPKPQGLAVWQRTTSSIVLPGGSLHNFDSVREVIDLVESPLPDKLFHPPDGYRRVEKFSDFFR